LTMHINLSDEMKGFIKGKVADGFYGNATEDCLSSPHQRYCSRADSSSAYEYWKTGGIKNRTLR